MQAVQLRNTQHLYLYFTYSLKLFSYFISTHHHIPHVAPDKGFYNTAYRSAKHTESQNG